MKLAQRDKSFVSASYAAGDGLSHVPRGTEAIQEVFRPGLRLARNTVCVQARPCNPLNRVVALAITSFDDWAGGEVIVKFCKRMAEKHRELSFSLAAN